MKVAAIKPLLGKSIRLFLLGVLVAAAIVLPGKRADAALFLVSDPVAGCPGAAAPCPTSFNLSLDAGAVVNTPAQSDGSLHWDASSLPNGSHVMAVSAVNTWGSSSAVNFTFNRQVPLPPANLRLGAQ